MSRVASDLRCERMRAFLAAEPGAGARRSAEYVARRLRGRPQGDDVRWVAPESLHVTLRFLGDIDAEQASRIERHVAAAVREQPPFELELHAIEAFPTRRRPRVLVLSLRPETPVTRLAVAVERGVVAAGLPPEERGFRPHLTLGRVRRGRRGPALDPAPEVDPAPFAVREVVLFRSRTGAGGPRYTSLGRMSLGESDHPSTLSLEEGSK